MISIRNLLGIIATEAIEMEGVLEDEFREIGPAILEMPLVSESADKLPPIDYKLELIKTSDGTLYWVE